MFKTSALTAAVAAVVFTLPVHAGSERAIEAANTRIFLAYGKLNQEYTEYNDGLSTALPAILNTERGSIPAYELGGSVLLWGGFYSLRMQIAHGDVQYNGYTNTTPPQPLKTTSTNTLGGAIATGGYLFKIKDGLRVGPVIDVGGYQWQRVVGQGTGLEYMHGYYRLGLMAAYGATDDLAVRLEALTGKTFGANVTAPQFGFENEKLGDEKTVRAAITLDYRLWKKLHMAASAEYHTFGYGQSKVSDLGAVEPRSETKQLTYSVSLGYSFR